MELGMLMKYQIWVNKNTSVFRERLNELGKSQFDRTGYFGYMMSIANHHGITNGSS